MEVNNMNIHEELLANIEALKIQKEIRFNLVENSMKEWIHSLNLIDSIKMKVHECAEDRDLRQDLLKIVLSYGLQYFNKRINN